MKEETQKILLSPYFILGLLLLLLNDFFLKQQFHNFLTGKLSDFAGLFVFPLFFAAFFPKRKVTIYISTVILFIFWKSQFSQTLIDFLNSFGVFRINRVVDYTDLFGLLVLPFAYLYCKTETQRQMRFPTNSAKRFLANFVVLLSVFAFTATSLADEQNIRLEGEHKFKLSKSDIESILRQNKKIINLEIQRETDAFPANQYPDVKADPNGFYTRFRLNQQICDSDTPDFFFHIQEEKGFASISGTSIHFRCKAILEQNSNTAYKQYLPELNAIFEREVIEKLRQNNSQ